MGCALAIVFGLAGAAMSLFLRHAMGQTNDPVMSFFVFLFSGAFTVPLGYFIGAMIEKANSNREKGPKAKPLSQFRPQIAGGKCAVCERNILMAGDGWLCPTCNRPVHHECTAQHACPPPAAG